MSLKNALILVMGLTVLLIVGLSAAVLVPMKNSFAELEEAEGKADGERVLAAVAAELEHLDRSAKDWSTWDEAYNFVRGEHPTFEEENLGFTTLSNLGLNLMFFYDRDGRAVWGKIYDLATEAELPLEHFAGTLKAEDVLLSHGTAEGGTRGLLATEAGPMLVVSTPIVPTNADAPPSGSLVLGRLLDRAAMDAIAAVVSVDFDIEVATHATDGGESRDHEHSGSFSILSAGGDAVRTHALLNDVYGRPLLHVTAWTPRDISAVGDRAVQFALLSLLAIGLVDIVLMWLLLQRLVLRRVTGVTEHVVRVANAGIDGARVPVKGKDELSLLAREFNRMLDRLAEARAQLVEQSHSAGMSEMAAGVLHNLRNGLAPLVGRLEGVVEKLRGLAGGQLGRAVEEIANPATDEARRSRLLEYVAAAGTSITEAKEELVGELTALTSHARKLGEIVKYQDKFIYSRSVVQPTEIGAAVADAIALLPPKVRAQVTLQVDPAVERLPSVLAERIALMQIFHNLLMNASEAISCAGKTTGTVTIEGHEPAPGMVEVSIRDNGVGIAADELPKIFARGYTTKPSGAGGLGLHWCANAAANVQGRLSAASEGPGAGATFRLTLPAAEQRAAA